MTHAVSRVPCANMAFNRTPAYVPSFSRAPVGGRRLTWLVRRLARWTAIE